MFNRKNLNTIGQVAAGIGYGLYLSFLAPKSQRKAEHKWLKQQEATQPEVVEEVPEVETQPEVEVIADPWEGEVEVINQCFYSQEPTPVIYLLPAAPEVVEQPPIDYSDWTIRALKKEAQRRQLRRYSNLTKPQLITALAAN